MDFHPQQHPSNKPNVLKPKLHAQQPASTFTGLAGAALPAS